MYKKIRSNFTVAWLFGNAYLVPFSRNGSTDKVVMGIQDFNKRLYPFNTVLTTAYPNLPLKYDI